MDVLGSMEGQLSTSEGHALFCCTSALPRSGKQRLDFRQFHKLVRWVILLSASASSREGHMTPKEETLQSDFCFFSSSLVRPELNIVHADVPCGSFG